MKRTANALSRPAVLVITALVIVSLTFTSLFPTAALAQPEDVQETNTNTPYQERDGATQEADVLLGQLMMFRKRLRLILG